MRRKVLILPIFQMPSGHHQVADTVADFISEEFSGVSCRKKDFLTYCGPGMEALISKSYIKWIKYFPASYHYIYNQSMEVSASAKSENTFMKPMGDYFERKMLEMVAEEDPDVIICTHSFPSNVLNRLKMKGLIATPVINIYTDFFISNLWGKSSIDYHFTPNRESKELLTDKWNIPSDRVITTGIPIHHSLSVKSSAAPKNSKRILVAGGNFGLGNMEDFILKINNKMELTVLCGNNEKLFKLLKSKNYSNVNVYSYIASREKMNELYNQVDAVITKPGGLTVSEALAKGLPIFTVHALPGQERGNLEYLKKKRLIYQLSEEELAKGEILQILENEIKKTKYEKQIVHYLSGIEMPPEKALKYILEMCWTKANQVMKDKVH
jgi:UDP-N-acetylglucosamine:LPS N-acetylglucosamine transferase